jgi:alpha-galactosidase
MKQLITLAVLLLSFTMYAQKYDGLAKTPPMGWNSWNKFACDVSEKHVREAADAMVSSGMKDAGYKYIVIDDCWQGERDSLGFIQPDLKRFPSGIKALADYVHSLGLKFGIYSDVGWKTCGGKTASRGHEFQDAISYASWGVDYLKYDWCSSEFLNAKGAYITMREALYAARRPIVFSICEWGDNKPWEWAAEVGHLWRTTGDISPVFDSVVNHGTWNSFGVMQIVDKQIDIRKYNGPDHWNDPDMLEVGNGMSNNEDKAHFTMWCILSAPLIAGNDLFNMSKETKEILTNAEVIAIDQDSLGISGYKYSSVDGLETWVKPLQNGDWAVCYLNRSKKEYDLNYSWQKNNIVDTLTGKKADFEKDKYGIRDLWAHKDAGTTNKNFTAKIASRDAVLVRLSLKK